MMRVLATGEYVSQVGIEPTTRGLKVPCSTTELLAQTLSILPAKPNYTYDYYRPRSSSVSVTVSVIGEAMSKERANGEGPVYRTRSSPEGLDYRYLRLRVLRPLTAPAGVVGLRYPSVTRAHSPVPTIQGRTL